jgi:hypothetical protein
MVRARLRSAFRPLPPSLGRLGDQMENHTHAGPHITHLDHLVSGFFVSVSVGHRSDVGALCTGVWCRVCVCGCRVRLLAPLGRRERDAQTELAQQPVFALDRRAGPRTELRLRDKPEGF